MKKLIITLAFIGAVSFSLTISAAPPVNSAPLIDPIADQTIFENTVLDLPFTVHDPDPGHLDALFFLVSSPNPSLLGNYLITGTGSDRTLTLAPFQDETGTTTILLSAIDPLGLSHNRSFQLTVLPQIVPTVPDSGSSLLLAGLAFAGLMTFRRFA
ncbi:MAG: VPDSG-CTERM sorting domain-containing protein [Verrucomicrobiales bacterium]|nr:VPDSG-CTERM sorting domain-containing protein [Verrucomicrobiales bacterium]